MTLRRRPVALAVLAIGTVSLLIAAFRWYVGYRETLAIVNADLERRSRASLGRQTSEGILAPYEVSETAARHGDLRLFVVATKDTFEVGEEILVRLIIANASPDVLVIPSSTWVAQDVVRWDVTRSGNPVSFTGVAPDMAVPQYPCDFRELRPREFYGLVISLSSGTHAFDISRPGTYCVTATLRVTAQSASTGFKLLVEGCSHAQTRVAWTGAVSSLGDTFSVVQER